MKKLGIVLKITERCNLNCTYCYFFNGLDDSYKNKPPRISFDTIDQLLRFLYLGIEELNITHLIIGFHGGEPLLYGRENLSDLCDKFIATLSEKVNLKFTLQTNGLLINKKWIDFFEKYKIGVGVSIDGPKEYNDKHRVDHNGNGSYDKLVEKIRLLQHHGKKFGILSVINPTIGGKIMYDFFTRELGINHFDILFPHLTHDSESEYDISEYGKYICDLFDAWVEDNNPNIRIRFFDSFLGQLFGKSRLIYGIGAVSVHSLPLITIRGDGDIGPVTGLMSTDPNTVTNIGANVFNTTLNEILKNQIFQELVEAQTNMPQQCNECCWVNICGGGHIVDRFSTKNRFDNPSTYCNALKDFYAHITNYLILSGVSINKISKVLKI